MRRALALSIVVAAGAVACEDEPPPRQAPTSTLTTVPPTAAPTSTAEAPGAAYEDADLPVAADYADEAAEAIPLEGEAYKDELEDIEAKLGDGTSEGDEAEETGGEEHEGEGEKTGAAAGAPAPEPAKAPPAPEAPAPD